MMHAPETRAAQYARTFGMHRAALNDLYALLPDDQGTFSAWDGGLSFTGQADHLAGSTGRLLAMLAGQTPGPAADGSADLPGARTRLLESTETALAAIRSLSDEDMQRRVPAFGGREMPVSALLDMLVGHEAHHKGQVWVMARMVGVQPPMFVKMRS